MAVLPDGPTGTPWMITSINTDVYVIEKPGERTEKTHFVFDVTNPRAIAEHVHVLRASDVLTDDQKYMAVFWVGYFYAHFVRR